MHGDNRHPGSFPVQGLPGFRLEFILSTPKGRNDGYRSRLPVDEFRNPGLGAESRLVKSLPHDAQATRGRCYLDSFNSLTAFRAKVKSATSEDETSRDDFNVSLELAMNSCMASSETTPVSE